MWWLLLACVRSRFYEAPVDTSAPDTGVATAPDADGDGFIAWWAASDPALADCDDEDASVTPATERLVPEGWFTRGDDDSPGAAPARQIHLSAFCMDVFEVTNTRFAAFLQARADAGLANQDDQGRPLYDFEDDDDLIPEAIVEVDGHYELRYDQDENPVVEVWEWSGEAFCAARGQRLPTEAEWEKAARGDDARPWTWGEATPDCDRANIRLGPEGVGEDSVEPCYPQTLPGGSFPSSVSPWGIQDMAGNAAEWVSDWYQDGYYAESPDEDPQGPESGWGIDDAHPDGMEARVSRGGSFASSLDSAHTYWRYVEPAEGNSNGVSFRCARSLSRP